MKTVKVEKPKLPAQRGSRYWLIRLAILLGLPFLVYYGYCWGLWGRSSLILQNLFQCGCPIASEEARYPDNIDVIVSACKYQSSILSPSGRLLFVQEEESGITSSYLLNLETDKKTPFALPEGSNYFLTDELIFHSFHQDDEYILDVGTGIKYPIQDAKQLVPTVYSMGNIDPNLLHKALLSVDQIYLIDDRLQPTIALTLDFRTHPEKSFTFDVFDFPSDETDPVEQFLQQYNITYDYIPDRFPTELVSPDGRLIARAEGIYLTATEERIVEGYSVSRSFYGRKYFSVRGWAYDSGGAFYTTSGACLIVVIFPPFETPGCIIEIPQPLIIIKVPEEYLTSTQMP